MQRTSPWVQVNMVCLGLLVVFSFVYTYGLQLEIQDLESKLVSGQITPKNQKEKVDYELFVFVQGLTDQHLNAHDEDIETLAKAFKKNDFYVAGSLEIMFDRIKELEKANEKRKILTRWRIK